MPIKLDRSAGNLLALGENATGSRSGTALSSVYVYATSGAAIGLRWIAPVTATLTDVYVLLSAVAGTPGVLTCEVRNNISANATRPGVTLLGSQTQTPGTTPTKWVHFTFGTPVSVTVGVEYWLVIGDAGWTTGNTSTILISGGITTRYSNLGWRALSSSDGFTTNGTGTNSPPLVMKFNDGTLLGNPYSNTGNYSNNQRERGIKLLGLDAPLVISGAFFSTNANISGLKIYSGTTVPGGTTALTVTFGAGAADVGFAYFAPFTLQANTVYRVVLTYSGNAAQPNYFLNEDNSQADTLAAGMLGGNAYGTIDNGSGGWTDNTDRFPEMGLIVQAVGIVALRNPLQVNA